MVVDIILCLGFLVMVFGLLVGIIAHAKHEKYALPRDSHNPVLCRRYSRIENIAMFITTISLIGSITLVIYENSKINNNNSPAANPPGVVATINRLVNGDEIELGDLELVMRHGFSAVYLWASQKDLPQEDQQRIVPDVWQAINKAKVRIDLSPETKEIINQAAKPSIENKGN